MLTLTKRKFPAANGKEAWVYQISGTLTLLGTIPGCTGKEHELHLKYAALKRTGEWFELTDELRSDIQKMCKRKRPVRVVKGEC